MNFQIVQFLGVVAVGCHAALLRSSAGNVRASKAHNANPYWPTDPAPDWTGCGEPPSRYEDLVCDSVKDLDIGPGLIIAGQGGSATRAAQEVVQRADTHNFGVLDSDSGDSCATRWGLAFWNRNDVLAKVGEVDYKVEDVPSDRVGLWNEPLRATVERQTCTSMAILKDMINSTNNPEEKPWALKDPWLRLMLPFYTENLDVKFIHVTRDVRVIEETHDDDAIGLNLDSLESLVRFGYAKFPAQELRDAMAAGGDAHANMLSLQMEYPLEDVQKFSVFARIWAVVELSLYKAWMTAKPHQYFHISEMHMTNSSTVNSLTKKLALFLGNEDPSYTTLEKMRGVYKPEMVTMERMNHWNMMQAIVDEPRNAVVREALATFGYRVQKR